MQECVEENQDGPDFKYTICPNENGEEGLFLSGFPAIGRDSEVHEFGKTFKQYFFVNGKGICCGNDCPKDDLFDTCVTQLLEELKNHQKIIAVSRSNVALLNALKQSQTLKLKTIIMVAPEIPDESYLERWKNIWTTYKNTKFHIHYSEVDGSSAPLKKLTTQPFNNVSFYKYTVQSGSYDYGKYLEQQIEILDNKDMGHGTVQKSFMDYYKFNNLSFKKDIFVFKAQSMVSVRIVIHMTSRYRGTYRAEQLVQELLRLCL